MKKYILFLSTLLLNACTMQGPPLDLTGVRQQLSPRMPYEIKQESEVKANERINTYTQAVLQQPLTLDQATQIALFHNPSLQVIYAELGIAQADVIEASLLANPIIGADVRPLLSEASLFATNAAASAVMSLLELITLRDRQRLAATQFEATQMDVADHVLDIISQVQQAYYTLQGALAQETVVVKTIKSAAASYEFARRLFEAGNLSELVLAQEKAFYKEQQLELIKAQNRVKLARISLQHQLGTAETFWQIPPTLPPLPSELVFPSDLKEQALCQRLDLAFAQEMIAVNQQALDMAIKYAWIPFLEVGLSAEREIEGPWVMGPELAIALPIFNRNQATIARWQARLQQSQQEFAALRLKVFAEVTTAQEKMIVGYRIAKQYQQELMPLRQRVTNLMLHQYNFMLKGTFDLLQTKQMLLHAERDYIEALTAYWSAHVDLEQALGQRFY